MRHSQFLFDILKFGDLSVFMFMDRNEYERHCRIGEVKIKQRVVNRCHTIAKHFPASGALVSVKSA